MDEEKRTLKDEIRVLNQNFEELVAQKKAKRFRFPRKARVTRRTGKQGYASICYINENRDVDFMRVPVKEGAMMINNRPYIATTDYMLMHKGKPFIIVPSWNVEPFSPKKNIEQAEIDNKRNVGYELLLNKILTEGIAKKKFGIGGALVFGLIILGIIAYYFLGGGGVA